MPDAIANDPAKLDANVASSDVMATGHHGAVTGAADGAELGGVVGTLGGPVCPDTMRTVNW